ncbi:MAG TPA: 5-methyltetrahydropteroyltriglutamate--homocysteine S-methyltransferase [Gemmatimonadales bacterium]|nr:5-methyltetrahydropteroyltriglutamate--homocysteine S-methyltransferase [Gemmatimonadales bacterium]
MARSHNLGFPSLGAARELKRATEGYWAGKIPARDLLETAKSLRARHWAMQRDAGIDLIPVNDFSLYDRMLDTCALVGAVPPRYALRAGSLVDLDTYFAMARGSQGKGRDVVAMEMTKWFDTNYHYLVPELTTGQRFSLSSTKPVDELREARALGVNAKPVLVGPVTFLLLSKTSGTGDRLGHLEALLPVYAEVLRQLKSAGAEWVQMDEPALALDRTDAELKAFVRAYGYLAKEAPGINILLATYFAGMGDNVATLHALPVAGAHLDLVRGAGDVNRVLEKWPAGRILSAGVVDGRNIWRSDLEVQLSTLERIRDRVGADALWVAPSCSLLHVPQDLDLEKRLDGEIKQWLAFAKQKLAEVSVLTQAVQSGRSAVAKPLAESRVAAESRRTSPRIHRESVRSRVTAVKPADERRLSSFAARRAKQVKLPPFPTTTIGSFPQTAEVRNARKKLHDGTWSVSEYDKFVEGEINRTLKIQEDLGLDVLVHGEFERNDMVEYFGEQLDGFAFTEHGWVQSYGSRYVKPPIIYGDVERPQAMTVRWSAYAQSRTKQPVKGMLTGPVTILQWSFVRNDQPRADTAVQIALVIRDEVRDLEQAGIRVIQIDEPALREGMPLKRSEQGVYLDWAVRAFRLATSGVTDATQIHTHMCYSEFNEVVRVIADMDADVISIENARSGSELLRAFREFKYPNEIGPGVYDIHSPRVPSVDEIVKLLHAAREVLDERQVWVNPDCGLKTRGWPETMASLTNLVAAAKQLRG